MNNFFARTFPIPKELKTPALTQYFSSVKDDTAARELHQLVLQAECGRQLLKAIANELKLGNYSILNIILLPNKIRTEDGWEFHLTAEQSYVSGDGTAYQVTKILDLISMSPEEREQDITPAFTIEWDD